MTVLTSAVSAPATAAAPHGNAKKTVAGFTDALQGAVDELSAVTETPAEATPATAAAASTSTVSTSTVSTSTVSTSTMATSTVLIPTVSTSSPDTDPAAATSEVLEGAAAAGLPALSTVSPAAVNPTQAPIPANPTVAAPSRASASAITTIAITTIAITTTAIKTTAITTTATATTATRASDERSDSLPTAQLPAIQPAATAAVPAAVNGGVHPSEAAGTAPMGGIASVVSAAAPVSAPVAPKNPPLPAVPSAPNAEPALAVPTRAVSETGHAVTGIAPAATAIGDAVTSPTSPASTVSPAPPVAPTFASHAIATAPTLVASAPPPSFAAQVSKPLFSLAGAAFGDHTVTITVTPDTLGPVTVQAHVSADGMRVQLFAPNDAGRDALRAVLPDLRRDLAGSGIGSSLDLSSQNQPNNSGGDTLRGSPDMRQVPNDGIRSHAPEPIPERRPYPQYRSSSTIDVMA